MKKILATTDFSVNSKAGIRFAIQLAAQGGFELTFFHSCKLIRSTFWDKEAFRIYEKAEEDRFTAKLKRFIESIYRGMGLDPVNYSCVAMSGVVADANIRDFAVKNHYHLICMSTKGAGKQINLLGTNTANLINHSEVPVIAVPFSYRTKEIKNLMYCSDLVNLDQELREVSDITQSLKVPLEVLHFTTPSEMTAGARHHDEMIRKLRDRSIPLHLKKNNFLHPLAVNIEKVVNRLRPSLLVMFTRQERNFFEKIFLSSISAEYAFHAKVPLLVFRKLNHKS